MLSNGRATKSAISLDFCGRHLQEAHRTFKVRGGRGVRGPDKGKRTNRPRTDYAKLEQVVLAYAKTHETFTARDALRKSHIANTTQSKVINQMLKAKKLKATGKNRARRLSLP